MTNHSKRVRPAPKVRYVPGSTEQIFGTGITQTVGESHRSQSSLPIEVAANDALLKHEHLWVAMATHRLTEDTLRDAVEKGASPNLDVENLLSINLGCFICELVFKPKMLGTICGGPR